MRKRDREKMRKNEKKIEAIERGTEYLKAADEALGCAIEAFGEAGVQLIFDPLTRRIGLSNDMPTVHVRTGLSVLEKLTGIKMQPYKHNENDIYENPNSERQMIKYKGFKFFQLGKVKEYSFD